jgi:NAD(P)-dependent dehydrogenase (short-subunit alcohol dehydrogenase family)
MKPTAPKVVLVTGCSTGIGRAAADDLVRRGHVVYATARRPESVEELRQWAASRGPGAHAARLDVEHPHTVDAAVARVFDEQGRIDVLVNNAGFGQAGAFEDVPPEQWRRQFEVNLFGLIEVTRRVLPGMRERGSGRIVNVSSVVAHVVVPFMGAYAASKHALDAASAALRMEVKRWGIQVVLIEPGPIQTEFRRNVLENVQKAVGADSRAEDSPYAEGYRVMRQRRSGPEPGAGTADQVAVAIRRAVESRRPRTRYTVTPIARWVPLLARLLPDRVFDAIMIRSTGLSGFVAPIDRPSR